MEIYFFTGSWCITEHCYVWWRWERKIWSFVDVSGSSKIHASLTYECKVNFLLLFSLMFQSPVSYIVLILTITVITPLTRLSLLQWKRGSFKKVDFMLLLNFRPDESSSLWWDWLYKTSISPDICLQDFIIFLETVMVETWKILHVDR